MQTLVKVQDGKVVKYPYTYEELKRDNPNVSFPKYENMSGNDFEMFDTYVVQPKEYPIVDPIVYSVISLEPKLEDNGIWTMQFEVVEKSEEEKTVFKNVIKQRIAYEVQRRLNEFAEERGYDNIISACSYINSTVTKYRDEAEVFISLRDQTWTTLYQIYDDAETGKRKFPSDYADIVMDLPTPVWP